MRHLIIASVFVFAATGTVYAQGNSCYPAEKYREYYTCSGGQSKSRECTIHKDNNGKKCKETCEPATCP